MKVLVLGAGKMTEAILMGLRDKENLLEWMIYSPSGTSAQKLAGAVGCRFVADLNQVKAVDVVLLGCKPQQLKDLSVTLPSHLRSNLFVSMLAAIPEKTQLDILGAKEMIRIMPNMPVKHREGITLLSSESAQSRLKSFETLFSKLGTSMAVKEEELEELTLLTGSGPAFFYEFAKNFSESFESLDEKAREKLVRQVLKGAAVSALNSTEDLSVMREAVTSKGGVTIAVLEHWWNENLGQLIRAGINRGKERAQELKAILRS